MLSNNVYRMRKKAAIRKKIIDDLQKTTSCYEYQNRNYCNDNMCNVVVDCISEILSDSEDYAIIDDAFYSIDNNIPHTTITYTPPHLRSRAQSSPQPQKSKSQLCPHAPAYTPPNTPTNISTNTPNTKYTNTSSQLLPHIRSHTQSCPQPQSKIQTNLKVSSPEFSPNIPKKQDLKSQEKIYYETQISETEITEIYNLLIKKGVVVGTNNATVLTRAQNALWQIPVYIPGSQKGKYQILQIKLSVWDFNPCEMQLLRTIHTIYKTNKIWMFSNAQLLYCSGCNGCSYQSYNAQ
jgi:hypothetical protein